MTVSEFINLIGFRVKNNDVNNVNKVISDIKNTASKALGAIGLGISLTAINSLVEEFSLVNQQVRNATSALGEQTDIQQKILAAAKATRSSYQQTASVVSNLVQENSELFGTIDKAIAFNNAATMLFKTAGKTNDEIAGLMEAINKSFAKGYVDSETLSQLLERSPEAVKLLCAELGTTQDQLEQLASDGKFTVENLYNAFVNNAGTISSAFGNVKMTVTEAITVVRNQWGLWLEETNEMLDVTGSIGRIVINASDIAIRALTSIRTAVGWLMEKLGGTENVLKLVGVVAASIFAYQTLGNLLVFIEGIRTMDKVLLKAKARMVATIAIIVALFLIIDDFVNFLKGNNSLLSEILTSAGIDADAVRETIINAWQTLTSFLLKCWEGLKTACSAIWGAIKGFFEEHGESIKAALVAVWEVIKTVLVTAWNIIKTVAVTVFSTLKSFWEKNGESVKNSLQQIWTGIVNQLSALWNGLVMVATFVFGLLKSYWDTWGATITAFFSGTWNVITTAFGVALDALAGLLAVFGALLSGDWASLWENIKSLISTIWNGILSIIGSVLSVIWSVISAVFNVIWGFIVNIWNGILNFISAILSAIWNVIVTIWNGIVSTISSVLNAIWSAIVTVWNGIVSTISNVVNTVQTTVSDAFNALKSTVSTIWNTIKDAITNPINDAWDAVNDVVEKLKKAFDFEWELPKLKIPTITVTGGEPPYGIGGTGSLPKFDIKWNKEGGILTKPTIFGTIGGKLLGGGEAGKEAILPLSELWTEMRSMISDGVNRLISFAAPLLGVENVSGSTVSTVTNSSVNRTVVQNVNFHNEFHGERAAQQRTSTTMKKAATDTTAELARGLAFAR